MRDKDDVARELGGHIGQRYRDLRSGGAGPSDAAAAVRPDVAGARELIAALPPPRDRDAHVAAGFGGDVRYAWRMVRRSPAFALIVVFTLALGIGANTSLFSIVNAVLLNPLPFPDPDQLVAIHESKQNFESGSISLPNFFDWQRDNQAFAAMAVSRPVSFTVTGRGDAERVRGEFVSSDFFRLLGVQPILGRTFNPGEDRIGGGPPLALVGEGFWTRKLESRRDIVGQTLALDDRDYTIVGVMPASIDLQLPSFRPADVYVPIGQWNNPILNLRTSGLGIHGVGRLKPGVTIEQARSDMERVTRNLAAAFPDANKGIGATLVPLKRQMVGDVEPLLIVLLVAVGFVLLIACVNVANLVLARSTERSREFAIRAALGASPGRVVRQLLTESVGLALAGGLIGLLFTGWITRAVTAALPSALPRAGVIHVDGRVLLFCLLASIAAGVAFGVAPAFKSAAADLHEPLKEGGRGASGARHRLQSAFVIAEMALALVLLVGAGLTIRTLINLWRLDLGFRPDSVMTLSVRFGAASASRTAPAARAALRRLHDDLASVPGVQAVSVLTASLPLSGDDEVLFWPEGQPKPSSPNDMNWSLRYVVEPEYLQAMNLRLERGRFLTSQDDERASSVAVVDDAFAAKYFPNQDAVGKRVNVDDLRGPTEIVGIVRHVKQWGIDSDDRQALQAQMYLPLMQQSDAYTTFSAGDVGVVLRAETLETDVLAGVRRQVMAMGGVMYGAETMNDIVAKSLATRRFSMLVFGAFAALALVLAAVGIYGVVSYVVGQRTHEFGVRIALGARRADLLRLVWGEGARMAGIGVALGAAAALVLTQVMAKWSLLFGVSAADPLTFTAVAALLVVVALTACYVPARRATVTDPLTALRAE